MRAQAEQKARSMRAMRDEMWGMKSDEYRS
jgi:hypothetical protein